MFGLFKSNKPELPIDDDQRKWLEHAYMYLLHQFGADNVFSKDTLTPKNYQFEWSNKKAFVLAKRMAEVMEINPEEIQIEFFERGIEGFYTTTGDILFTGQEGIQNPAGQYLDKNENGKYLIALADNLYKDPESLIATIAHEFSHIKLLGEKRLDFNDEHLTDVVPLMFGLGIFSANASFKFKTSHQGWGYSKGGYLSQMDWGYLLALHAFMRYDDDPDWLQYLNKQLQYDYSACAEYIKENENLLFKHLQTNDDPNNA